MNDQEFFDKAIAHLRAQGMRAGFGASSGCKYTFDAGNGKTLHCGVGGVMSPDLRQKLIAEDLNGNSIEVVIESSPTAATFFKGVGLELMKSVQVIHDQYDPDVWEEQLEQIAIEYKLTYTPVGAQ